MRRSFSRIAAVLTAIAVLGHAAVLLRPAAAAEAGPPGAVLAETDAPAQPAAATGDFWTRDTLLGDIAGLRSAIAPYGATLGLSETSEILGNLTGGRRVAVRALSPRRDSALVGQEEMIFAQDVVEVRPGGGDEAFARLIERKAGDRRDGR